jgi:MraZ protein
MFLGQYQLCLDDGHYLTVPASFRETLAEGFYITQGFEKDLLIVTDKAFRELYQRVISMNIADPLARLLLRMILGNASRLEMDELGRVQIPHNLAAFAGLDKASVLVGQGDYIEIWSPTMWEEQHNNLQDTEANAERFALLDLAAH